MKILLVNKLYHPHIGGVESVVKWIAEGLKDKISIEVLACQFFGLSKKEIINGVKVTKAGAITPLGSAPLSLSLYFIFRKLAENADIIHLHCPFPQGEIAYLMLPKRLRKKLIISWHSDIVRQSWFLPIHKLILDKLLSSASNIIVATPNHITSSRFLPKFKDKCEIIPFGIDVKSFDLLSSYAQEIDDIKNKYGRFVLFVGRLNYYKGVEYLIKAFVRINASLVIVGEGKYKKILIKIAEENNIIHKIHFMGKMTDDQIRIFLNACEMFCLPSIYNSEAFGLVQLEAMACGKPVINTTLPTGVSYVSMNEETGLSVPPKDEKALANAINRLLNNDQERKIFGENAKKRVEVMFTREKMLADILRLYEKV